MSAADDMGIPTEPPPGVTPEAIHAARAWLGLVAP
jgi:hypothetical protein